MFAAGLRLQTDAWRCVAECLQTFVEKRKGGECGVSAVTMLEGDDVWNSLYGRPGDHDTADPLQTTSVLYWWSLWCKGQARRGVIGSGRRR